MRQPALLLAVAMGLTACHALPAHLGPGATFGLARATASAAGSLAVRTTLAHAPGARRLAAVAADVDRLYVQATSADASHTESIAGADLVNGAGEVRFTGLPAGDYAIAIEAVGPTGRTLGRASASAQVAPGAPAAVTATLVLTNGAGAPVEHLPAAQQGTGVGAMRAGIVAIEPAAVKTPPIEGRFLQGVAGLDVASVALHPDGSAWVTAGPNWGRDGWAAATPTRGKLYRIGANDAFEDRTPAAAPADPSTTFAVGSVAIEPVGGRVLVTSANANLGPAPGIVLGAGAQPDPGYAFSTTDEAILNPDGAIWTAGDLQGQTTILRQPSGVSAPTVVHTLDPEQHLHRLAVDRNGAIWAVTAAPAGDVENLRLLRFSAAGQLMVDRVVPGGHADWAVEAVRCDGAGNLIVVDQGQRMLHKYGPDGVRIFGARFAGRLNAVFVDAQDHAWVYAASRPYTNSDMDEAVKPFADAEPIARMAPDGRVLAHYHIARDVVPSSLAVAPDGTMWLGSVFSGLLKVKVDVPFAP